jgi:hypothetical protein
MKKYSGCAAGRLLPAALGPVVLALALTACGSGGSMSTPAPMNSAPAISGIGSQTVNQDTPAAMNFTVTDPESGPAAVQVAALSSDPAIFPPDGMVLTGSGADRSITIVPSEDATGSANVTLTATDPKGFASQLTFAVTVKPVEKSISALTTQAFSAPEDAAPAQVRGFTFVQDADDPATFDSLLQ